MKDERKIFIIILLLAASIVLFTIKASGQAGTFDHILLKDRHGEELLNESASIRLLPGKLEITEGEWSWQEEISLQTKSGQSCEVWTEAGHYLLQIEGERIARAYLRSNVGADRAYLSGFSEIFSPLKQN